DNIIDGDLIGTSADGTAAGPGNGGEGVMMLAVAGNTVGGTVAAARNIISANGGSGVLINGGPASANVVQGNYIGTNLSGTAPLGNAGRGVYINGASNNTVGGNTSSTSNLISANNGDGVLINGSSASGNVVQGNYVGTDIFANA